MNETLTIEQIQAAVNELRNQQIDNIKLNMTNFIVPRNSGVDFSALTDGTSVGYVTYTETIDPGSIYWSKIAPQDFYGICAPEILSELVYSSAEEKIKKDEFKTVQEIIDYTIDCRPIEQSELIEMWYERKGEKHESQNQNH